MQTKIDGSNKDIPNAINGIWDIENSGSFINLKYIDLEQANNGELQTKISFSKTGLIVAVQFEGDGSLLTNVIGVWEETENSLYSIEKK